MNSPEEEKKPANIDFLQYIHSENKTLAKKLLVRGLKGNTKLLLFRYELFL